MVMNTVDSVRRPSKITDKNLAFAAIRDSIGALSPTEARLALNKTGEIFAILIEASKRDRVAPHPVLSALSELPKTVSAALVKYVGDLDHLPINGRIQALNQAQAAIGLLPTLWRMNDFPDALIKPL
jgi:hypothetical protein